MHVCHVLHECRLSEQHVRHQLHCWYPFRMSVHQFAVQVDIDARDGRGDTALHLSSRRGHRPVVDTLLGKYVVFCLLPDPSGKWRPSARMHSRHSVDLVVVRSLGCRAR